MRRAVSADLLLIFDGADAKRRAAESLRAITLESAFAARAFFADRSSPLPNLIARSNVGEILPSLRVTELRKPIASFLFSKVRTRNPVFDSVIE